MKTFFIKKSWIKALAVALAAAGFIMLMAGALMSPVMEVFGGG